MGVGGGRVGTERKKKEEKGGESCFPSDDALGPRTGGHAPAGRTPRDARVVASPPNKQGRHATLQWGLIIA